MGHDFVVVHYAEIGIKGKNRGTFENKLVENIKKALEGLEYKNVRRTSGRILVELSKKSDSRKIGKQLEKVFGISGYNLAWFCKSDMKSIEEAAVETMKKAKGSFRVSAVRSWKQFKTDSNKVNEKVGAAIVKKYDFKVKLKNADTDLGIEILKEGSFIFTERFGGPGGLPVGVSGKVVCLLSGGIDSPVSALLMMKRGCEVEFIHFHNEVAGGLGKMEQILNIMKEYQPNARMHIIPFRKLQNEVITRIPAEWRIIIYRRMMLRIAQELAKKIEAKALVTGNALSQVSSQTLDNIVVIEEAVTIPVFSPLIGFDKIEIIALAKRYDTYEISIKPYDDCCIFMIAKHPITRAKLHQVKRLEKSLDTEKLVNDCIKSAH